MHYRALLVAMLLVVALLAVPQAAVADDVPDTCAEAETIPASSGTITGRLSPTDSDAYRVEMAEGDFLSATIERSNVDAQIAFDQQLAGEQDRGGNFFESDYESESKIERESDLAKMSVADLEDGDLVSLNDGLDRYLWTARIGGEIRIHIYKENDAGPACLDMRTDDGAATAYNISYRLNDAEPPALPSQERVEELQTRVDELNATVEEKDRRIADLESQLEAQSDGGSDVTIDVTVAPANDRERFVEGGAALVEAGGDSPDPEEFSVEFDGTTYQSDTTGQAVVPLTAAGSRELSLAYANATKSLTLDVQQQDADGTVSPRDEPSPSPSAGGSNEQRNDGGDGGDAAAEDGPGFGVLTAVLAVLVAALTTRRRM